MNSEKLPAKTTYKPLRLLKTSLLQHGRLLFVIIHKPLFKDQFVKRLSKISPFLSTAVRRRDRALINVNTFKAIFFTPFSQTQERHRLRIENIRRVNYFSLPQSNQFPMFVGLCKIEVGK